MHTEINMLGILQVDLKVGDVEEDLLSGFGGISLGDDDKPAATESSSAKKSSKGDKEKDKADKGDKAGGSDLDWFLSSPRAAPEVRAHALPHFKLYFDSFVET
jgi:hypothetical protein